MLKLTLSLLLLLTTGGLLKAAPSDATRQQLDALFTNIKGSTMHRYDAKDNTGQQLAAAKIIPDPNGGYLIVYHSNIGSSFAVSLATSSDLMNWTFQVQLALYAADPTIYARDDGSFVMAWEQTNSAGAKNHIHFAYYPNRSALIAGTPSKSFDCPMTLSKYAEGTPNIYSVTTTNNDISTSVIDTGGHYNDNTLRLDRQQRGTLTNFSSWTTSVRRDYDNAILYYGIKGSIGDRDPITFNGYQFNFIEGQSTAKDFGTWKLYNFDFATGNADQLSVVTDGGSQSFGNPSATYLIGPDGNPCMVCSAFIFSQNCAPGEPGSCIYYTTLPVVPTFTAGPPPSPAPLGAAYSFTYTATGYPAPAFAITAGALPPGLTLSAAGVISGTPTQAGVYSGSITASNAQGASAAQSFQITVTRTYSQWVNSYFPGADPSTSAPTAAPLGDQTPNLLKYALGINPQQPLTASDRAALPTPGIDHTTTPGTDYLTLTYRSSGSATGVSVNLQVSSSLQSWTTVAPDFTKTLNTDQTTGDRTIEFGVDTQKGLYEYVRLQVTINS